MKRRRDVFSRSLDLRAQISAAGVALPAGDHLALLSEWVEAYGDWCQLRDHPSAVDPLEEMFLLFLARCRLIYLGPFQICSFIGAGQCGAVCAARLRDADEPTVAVKVLLFPRNDQEVFRFKQEAEVLGKLSHKNIVRIVHPVSTTEHLPVHWFAMELVAPARTLDGAIASASRRQLIEAMAQVCDGLAHAHDRGVVHRDLHLGNILVMPDMSARILDFGSAHFHSEAFTFRPVGTVLTCAPEKIFAPESVTGAADVFSVGCILYRIVMGKWPFYSTNFGQLIEHMRHCSPERVASGSSQLDEIIRLSMAANAAIRPSAVRVAQLLREL